MPAIHCKHCRHVSSSIGNHGRHMAKAHREILVAQLRRGAKKRGHAFVSQKHRAKMRRAPAHMGHKGELHLRADQRQKFIALLLSLLAMLKAMGRVSGKRRKH